MAKVKLYGVKVETQEQLEQLVIDIKNALADLSPSLAYDHFTRDDVLSVIDVIDDYIEGDYVFENYDGDLYSAILEAIYEYSDSFYYYSDCFDYLKEHNIYVFKDAVANGSKSLTVGELLDTLNTLLRQGRVDEDSVLLLSADDVCTIAYIYQQESLLNAFNQVVE